MRQLSVRVSGEHGRARPQPGNAPRRGQPGEAQPSLRPRAFSVIRAAAVSAAPPDPHSPTRLPVLLPACVAGGANCFILRKPNTLDFLGTFLFCFVLLVSNFLYLSPFLVSVFNLARDPSSILYKNLVKLSVHICFFVVVFFGGEKTQNKMVSVCTKRTATSREAKGKGTLIVSTSQ